MGEAAHPAQLPLVVKIGGSLVETERLEGALARISQSARPVVVVPGGGTFVDKVRDLQLALSFDDATAHRLAMLGMHQMAEMFVALNDRFRVTDSIDGIAKVLDADQVPVWVPLPTLDRDKTIPADWSITSDGIAARLAELLGGAPLVLLKSIDVNPNASAAGLANDGVVDAAFPSIVARAYLDWRVFGPGGDAALEAVLAANPAKARKS